MGDNPIDRCTTPWYLINVLPEVRSAIDKKCGHLKSSIKVHFSSSKQTVTMQTSYT